MEFLTWLLFALFAFFGGICCVLVVLGLPGTWLLLAVSLAIELLDGVVGGEGAGPGPVTTFGWPVLLGGAALAGVGEALEFASGAAGARLGGSTRRGMWGALLGGLLGALLLTAVVPVPGLGTLAGALLGTFLGAWIAEATGPASERPGNTTRAALAAVLGHLAGLLAKLAAAVAVWVLLLRALWLG